MSIKINDSKVFAAILEVPYHKKLVALALWYVYRYDNPIITSAHRKQKVWEGDSGIHMTIPGRALDFSVVGLIDPRKVIEDVNNHFEYDPGRPEMCCAIYHDVGQGPHIHLQVCDATVFYDKGRDSYETLISKI
jgi:hypothetical protein